LRYINRRLAQRPVDLVDRDFTAAEPSRHTASITTTFATDIEKKCQCTVLAG